MLVIVWCASVCSTTLRGPIMKITDDMLTEWRDVVGFEAFYEVSASGQIRNKRNNRIVSGTVYSKGYVVVCLSVGGNVERRLAHKIVAESWIGRRPDGMQIDHIDGNRRNNSKYNLRYVTAHQNILATVARGRQAAGTRNGQARLTSEQVEEIRATRAKGGRYWGAKQLADRYGVTLQTIVKAAAHKSHRVSALKTSPTSDQGEKS